MNLPVLIIGYERSGTTLLRRLVSMHPGLKYDLVHEKRKWLMNAKTKEEALDVLTFDSNQAGKKTGGTSSVRSGQKIPYANFGTIKRAIDKFYSFFPEFYLMHIIRNPLTTINSQVKSFNRKPQQCIKNWFSSVPLVYKYARSKPNNCVICYENLVTEPKTTLEHIYKWMGQEVSGEYIEKVINTRENWDYNGRQMPGLRRFDSIIPPGRKLILESDIITQINSMPKFDYKADF